MLRSDHSYLRAAARKAGIGVESEEDVMRRHADKYCIDAQHKLVDDLSAAQQKQCAKLGIAYVPPDPVLHPPVKPWEGYCEDVLFSDPTLEPAYIPRNWLVGAGLIAFAMVVLMVRGL